MANVGAAIGHARREPQHDLRIVGMQLDLRQSRKLRFVPVRCTVGGIKFELDMPIEPGTQLELRGMLPGGGHTTFRAVGKVVRMHSDADEPGPAVMGLQFESFQSPMDRHRLSEYIDARSKAQNSALRRAA